MHVAVCVTLQVVQGQFAGERLWSEWIFTYLVKAQTRVGLQRGAQSEMGGEGVIHEGYTSCYSIVGGAFGGANATDSSRIDLNEADLSVIDEVPGHIQIVRSLPPASFILL